MNNSETSSQERHSRNVRSSDNHLQSLIDLAFDAFIAIDDQGKVVDWNPQAEKTFGWSRAEIVGLRLADTIVPPKYRERHRRGLERFLATGEGPLLNRRQVVTALRRDGTEIPVEIAISAPTQLAHGFIFHAFVRDLSERELAADAIQASESLYHSLVDCLPIHVTRSDLTGRIIYANKTYLELVGTTEDEIIGKTNYDISPRHMAEKYERDDLHVIRTGEVFEDIEENTIAGQSYVFEVRKTPVRDAQGNIVATQAVFWDVTARERARAELARSNRDLDQFVSVVSHDLHAPIRAIVEYCNLLQERAHGQLDDETDEFLSGALDGAKRMQALISDLRDYARITRKDKPHRAIDCQRVLSDVLANLDVDLKESRANVTCDPLPTVRGDATQLMQLFQNLIGNAIKYCQGRTPEIHVSVESTESAWQFRVRDNGIGIAKNHVKDIFRIFQRLHADEAQFAGTGIGLATCKRIVERHGGEIDVESVPGEGSVFTFTLEKYS